MYCIIAAVCHIFDHLFQNSTLKICHSYLLLSVLVSHRNVFDTIVALRMARCLVKHLFIVIVVCKPAVTIMIAQW